MNNILSSEKVKQICASFKLPLFINEDHIYSIYFEACHFIEKLKDSDFPFALAKINHFDLLQYCIGEYSYLFVGKQKEEIDKEFANEQFVLSLASLCADKYISLTNFVTARKRYTSEYLPVISSLNVYLNLMLNILGRYERNNPSSSLITDLLIKSISLAKDISNQLVHGYETEAFALWRTLHECECTLVVLNRYGNKIIDAYLKHMKYGMAYDKLISSKEETDQIFVAIKQEMKDHDLKSKDMKKFIEYGWLYYVSDLPETFKLNFRDGLEVVAGLSTYKTLYTKSSEIIHSTPMLIYSNDEHFYHITLLCLYESFFRLEEIFASLFLRNISPEQSEAYQLLRKTYYKQLQNIYRVEVKYFIAH